MTCPAPHVILTKQSSKQLQKHMNPDTTIAYEPEVAQQVLTAIEEAEPITEEPEVISNDEYIQLLELAINDAEVWVSQAARLIEKIENGEKVKGTKLNGAVRNGRAKALISSLNDVSSAKVLS